MSNNPGSISDHALALAMEAFDFAANRLEATQKSFSPFLMTLDLDEVRSTQTLVSESPQQAITMAQSLLQEMAGQLVCYAIVLDAVTTISGIRRDSMVMEVGCGLTGKAAQLIQPYVIEPSFRKVGNLVFAGELDCRIPVLKGSRKDTENEAQPLFQAPFAMFKWLMENDEPSSQSLPEFLSLLQEGLDSANPLVAACVQHIFNHIDQYIGLLEQTDFKPLPTLQTARHVIDSQFKQAKGQDYLDFLKEVATRFGKSTQPPLQKATLAAIHEALS